MCVCLNCNYFVSLSVSPGLSFLSVQIPIPNGAGLFVVITDK